MNVNICQTASTCLVKKRLKSGKNLQNFIRKLILCSRKKLQVPVAYGQPRTEYGSTSKRNLPANKNLIKVAILLCMHNEAKKTVELVVLSLFSKLTEFTTFKHMFFPTSHFLLTKGSTHTRGSISPQMSFNKSSTSASSGILLKYGEIYKLNL